MFTQIKQYLNRMRNATYEILIDEPNLFQFEVRSKYFEKLFTIHYRDGTQGDRLDSERPRWYYYYLQFEQPNFPCRDRFCTLSEWKWYLTEEDVLNRIKVLKNRYQQ